ncbi:MAG TPA: hypothetical protein VGK06_11005 [Methanosarcina sp.]
MIERISSEDFCILWNLDYRLRRKRDLETRSVEIKANNGNEYRLEEPV